MIAEAWDAGGLYQVGHFPGCRWSEWNGRFRDDVRRFVRGDPGLVGAIATRISGSADMYQARGRAADQQRQLHHRHDGFTLNDLVSYNEKHNEANGEGNRDGIDDNLSWNCGVEGPSRRSRRSTRCAHAADQELRCAILFLSQGVPMFVAGDEVGRTQRGNNNAYCQDNEISWFDWTLVEENADLFRFFKRDDRAPAGTRACAARDSSRAAPTGAGCADIRWHGLELDQPDWDDPVSRVLAFTLAGDGRTPRARPARDDEHGRTRTRSPSRRSTAGAGIARSTRRPVARRHRRGRGAAARGRHAHRQGRSIVILVSKT